jgi:hypothetical protein
MPDRQRPRDCILQGQTMPPEHKGKEGARVEQEDEFWRRQRLEAKSYVIRFLAKDEK